MKTYWDHTEEEREALTREQVEDLCRFARMEAGVVIPPEVPPLGEMPEVDFPTKVYYRVSLEKETEYSWGRDVYIPLLFMSRSDAQQVLDLMVGIEDRDSDIDQNFIRTTWAKARVVEVELTTDDEVARARGDLEKAKTLRENHESLLRARSEAMEKARDAASGIWDDWSMAQLRAEDIADVRRTFAEYLEMCDGDEAMARKFLAKAYTDASLVARAIGEMKAVAVEPTQ